MTEDVKMIASQYAPLKIILSPKKQKKNFCGYIIVTRFVAKVDNVVHTRFWGSAQIISILRWAGWGSFPNLLQYYI